ncbi:hypothetical protein PG993_015013 [Apiospora rasikravindrae]|uniref:Intradiol ring-cleavage dioxygenases domain-containing protein n=1 Tax=Apiospora rasikravindrae TaxID=990691 RepID=A0ABR1RPE5_9PEZI
MVKFPVITAALAVCNLTVAHPGEDASAEQVKHGITSYSHAHQHMIRALSSCANTPPVLARQQRAAARRSETARQLRETRGIFPNSLSSLEKRAEVDLKKWAAKSHKVEAQYDPLHIAQQTTIGPYFVSGELMRTNVTDGQKGVPLHLDIQFISTANCSPIKDMVVDVWHSNATGVYSGVSATGQGGLGSNFCRGVQVTDADGVVEFDTVFPGHYAGRANHVHILSTKDAKLFFDRDLVSAVEATEPYKSNAQQFVDLLEDGIAGAAATSDYDVLMDYQMLGDSLHDGVLAWITVGVNVSANYNEQAPPAAHFTGSSGGGDSSAVDGGSNSSPSTTTSALGAPGSGSGTPVDSQPPGSSTPASVADKRSALPYLVSVLGGSVFSLLLF